jgi:hypothetical protein
MIIAFGNEYARMFVRMLKMDRRWEMNLYRGGAGYINLLPYK